MASRTYIGSALQFFDIFFLDFTGKYDHQFVHILYEFTHFKISPFFFSLVLFDMTIFSWTVVIDPHTCNIKIYNVVKWSYLQRLLAPGLNMSLLVAKFEGDACSKVDFKSAS